MADGQVRVFPDSTGARIDTEAITSGLNTVQRQRIRIGGDGLEDLATVTNNKLDVNVTIPGTPADACSDPSADGTIPLTGGNDELLSVAVSSGTYNITQWTWVADKQCSFRLQIYDNGILSQTVRVTMNAPSNPGAVMNFPTPIQVSGAANRTIKIHAQRLTGDNGEAGCSINGYTT